MVDILVGTLESFTIRATDDSSVVSSTLDGEAVTIEKASGGTIPVSLISKTPPIGDTSPIDATYQFFMGDLCRDASIKLVASKVSDGEKTSGGQTLLPELRGYKTVTFSMDGTTDRIHGAMAQSEGFVQWNFPDNQNSLSTSTYESGEYLNETFNTAAVRDWGVKYFSPFTQLILNDSPKLTINLAELQDCDALENLQANGTLMDFTGYDFALHHPSLRELQCSFTASNLNDAQVAAITNLEGLGASLTASTLTDAAFPNPSQLRYLSLNNCPNVTITDATIGPATMDFVDIGNSNATLTDVSLASMTGASFINLADINGTYTGAALAALASVTNLSVGSASITGLDDSVLAAWGSRIQALSFATTGRSSITPAGFAVLTGLTTLTISGMDWTATELNDIMTQLAATSPSLQTLQIQLNPGTPTIDKSGGSGYALLTGAGVNVIEA